MRGAATEDIRNRLLLTLFSLVALVGLWELSALAFVGTNPFPPPSQFIQGALSRGLRIGIGAQSTTIQESVLLSLGRVIVGMVVGIALTLPLAMVLASSQIAYRILHPIAQFFSPVAPLAWVPLGLLLFGIGNITAVFIVVLGVVFLLTLAFTASLRNQSLRYAQLRRALNAGGVRGFLLIVMPSAMPQIIGAIRVNFLAAWVALLAGEMTGLGSGLGAVVMIGRNLYDYNLVALGICLIAILGLTVDLLLQFLQERFFWWH